MTRRGGVVAALLAALALAPVALAAPAARIASVDTQGYPRLVVNVVTARPQASPPRLTENGAPVAGLQPVNLGAAKSVVVAIDRSRSMSGRSIVDARDAARAFVDAKAPGDRVAVYAFGHRAVQLAGFSASSSQADGVLQGLGVDATQGTALYDAIVAAARSLRTSTDAGRVIVVLTDGRDVSSTATLDDAVAAARRADASVYPIGIESKDFDPSALRTIAEETGGSYHGAGSTGELAQVYASIAAELDRTWRLEYDTAARPGDRITLRAGGGLRALDVPGSLGGSSAAPSRLLPSVFYSPLGTIVLGLLVGGLAIAALLQLVRMRRGSWVSRRLAAHVVQTQHRSGAAERRLSFLKALFRATESALGRHAKYRSIARMLVRGDVPLRPAEFIWLSVGCGLAGAFLFVIGGAPGILALIATVAAGALPYGFVWLRVRRRIKTFENQLPDMLTTIAASLKAGHSFKHGLQAVVDEAQPPSSVELKRVLTEAGLGRPLDDALLDMADRVGSENFGFAITAVTIQRQVGGSLATLFDMVSETVRNRQQFSRKIRSLTAMGRMSAYTLIAIPFFIAGMITVTNPSYMSPLLHTGLGHMLMFLGLGMMIVGSLILKKIVSFRG